MLPHSYIKSIEFEKGTGANISGAEGVQMKLERWEKYLQDLLWLTSLRFIRGIFCTKLFHAYFKVPKQFSQSLIDFLMQCKSGIKLTLSYRYQMTQPHVSYTMADINLPSYSREHISGTQQKEYFSINSDNTNKWNSPSTTPTAKSSLYNAELSPLPSQPRNHPSLPRRTPTSALSLERSVANHAIQQTPYLSYAVASGATSATSLVTPKRKCSLNDKILSESLPPSFQKRTNLLKSLRGDTPSKNPSLSTAHHPIGLTVNSRFVKTSKVESLLTLLPYFVKLPCNEQLSHRSHFPIRRRGNKCNIGYKSRSTSVSLPSYEAQLDKKQKTKTHSPNESFCLEPKAREQHRNERALLQENYPDQIYPSSHLAHDQAFHGRMNLKPSYQTLPSSYKSKEHYNCGHKLKIKDAKGNKEVIQADQSRSEPSYNNKYGVENSFPRVSKKGTNSKISLLNRNILEIKQPCTSLNKSLMRENIKTNKDLLVEKPMDSSARTCSGSLSISKLTINSYTKRNVHVEEMTFSIRETDPLCGRTLDKITLDSEPREENPTHKKSTHYLQSAGTALGGDYLHQGYESMTAFLDRASLITTLTPQLKYLTGERVTMSTVPLLNSMLQENERLYPLVYLLHRNVKLQQSLMGEELIERNTLEMKERQSRKHLIRGMAPHFPLTPDRTARLSSSMVRGRLSSPHTTGRTAPSSRGAHPARMALDTPTHSTSEPEDPIRKQVAPTLHPPSLSLHV
ncbi:unnamed protein product [Phytomonas sp. EM1]|nr:unnamed protein product [Phytomonas sp. EM1]|eukprot:CCW61052.1 unnamed protein product [Phytomonas sp. isolate EM1]